MAAAVNKRLLLLFYLRQRRKRKQKYRKKYWIRDIFRSRFLLGEYHTSSINKASTSEFFPMLNNFVDKMDDRAQHGAHVARDVM